MAILCARVADAGQQRQHGSEHPMTPLAIRTGPLDGRQTL
jgi:hypothetical protein